jgi:hypothetical protein
VASYRDFINFFSGGQAGVRRKRAKKNFCINCDTGDPEKIGKGKRCEICDCQLAVNPYFGNWKPYTNYRPFAQIRLAIPIFLLIFSWGAIIILKDILAGDVACEGTACGNPVIDGMFLIIVWALITGFLSWSFGAGLLINYVYNHPGWAYLDCPECGHGGKEGQGKGGAENFGAFMWNRVLPATCPKCKLKFEIENVSQWGWPHDDEPHEGKIYGDPTKIRVKPEIPFRFLKFIIKKNERFQSNHYELIKVIPITATILGIAWFFGMLDLVIILSFVLIAFYIFVWNNILFKPIWEFYGDILDEAFDIEEGYAGVMRWPNTPLKKAAIAFTFLLTCFLALLFLPGGIIQNSDNPWIRALGELIWDIIIFILELIFYWS